MFTPLTDLKAYILPETIRAKDDWDNLLQVIGSGVAEQFDRHCNRKLRRAESDTVEFSADRAHYILPRYPVETVTSVEIRDGYGEAWDDETAAIDHLDQAAGILRFESALGTYKVTCRVTYTGGYFVDLTGSTAQPVGSTAMPADLMAAWYAQCAHVFEQRDKLGKNFSGADRGLGGALVGLIQIGLTEPVIEMLRPHIRYQIT